MCDNRVLHWKLKLWIHVLYRRCLDRPKAFFNFLTVSNRVNLKYLFLFFTLFSLSISLAFYNFNLKYDHHRIYFYFMSRIFRVKFQTSHSWIRFLTNVAFEWSFFCMSEFVCFEMSFRNELIWANRAWVWTFTCVCSYMGFQITCFSELFKTTEIWTNQNLWFTFYAVILLNQF